MSEGEEEPIIPASADALLASNERWERRFTQMMDNMEAMNKAISGLQQVVSSDTRGTKRGREENGGNESPPSTSHPSPKRGKKTNGEEEDSDSEAETEGGELFDDGYEEDSISIHPGDGDDLLATLNAELEVEKDVTGAVADSVSTTANKRFSRGFGDEIIKAKLEKYPRPVNCEKLIVPAVNPEVWRKLGKFPRKIDLRTAHIQRALTKAAIAVTQCTNHLVKTKAGQSESARKETNVGIDHCVDALLLLGHAHRQLSMGRRASLRRYLPEQSRSLCEESVPITANLFGDDLPASLKGAKELSKLGIGDDDGDNRSGRFLDKRKKGYKDKYRQYNQYNKKDKSFYKKKKHNSQSDKNSQ